MSVPDHRRWVRVGRAQSGPRLPDLLFTTLNSGLEDPDRGPKKLGSLHWEPGSTLCVTPVSAVPSLSRGFFLHHRAAAAASKERLKMLSPASDKCATWSQGLACQQSRYRQRASGGLTAALAGWNKWLAEPGGGARAKTGHREEKPQGNPGLRGCSGHSDPSSEAPDPTWPLRVPSWLQTTHWLSSGAAPALMLRGEGSPAAHFTGEETEASQEAKALVPGHVHGQQWRVEVGGQVDVTPEPKVKRGFSLEMVIPEKGHPPRAPRPRQAPPAPIEGRALQGA